MIIQKQRHGRSIKEDSMGNGKMAINDPDLRYVGRALRRAAAKAKALALETGTPFYVWENGRIVDALKGVRRRKRKSTRRLS